MKEINPNSALQIEQTEKWVRKFVVKLNICPFAGGVVEKDNIRYHLSKAENIDILYQDFLHELLFLHESSPEDVETSILIHPNVLNDFDLYLDFLDLANEAIADAGLEGHIQVASFHPEYCFEGENPASVSNFTNRSPYPMLHLLRESSVTRAVESHPNIEGIPLENISRLEELGLEKVMEIAGVKDQR